MIFVISNLKYSYKYCYIIIIIIYTVSGLTKNKKIHQYCAVKSRLNTQIFDDCDHWTKDAVKLQKIINKTNAYIVR